MPFLYFKDFAHKFYAFEKVRTMPFFNAVPESAGNQRSSSPTVVRVAGYPAAAINDRKFGYCDTYLRCFISILRK